MDGNWDHLLAAGGIFAVILGILLFIAAILWIFLPFAVFGVKGRLDALISQTRKTNELLQVLNQKSAASDGSQKG